MFRGAILLLSLILSLLSFAAEGNSTTDDIIFHSPSETYQVEKKLGEGFFGNVYCVIDSTGEHYALKMYKPHHDSHYLLADAEREFFRGQYLNHPNIIKSYDYFTDYSESELPINCIILEYVEGKILWFVEKRTIKGKNAFKIVGDFVDALKYALELGFIHVDLHGGNIMLTKSGEAKIIDLASFTTLEELLQFDTAEAPHEPLKTGARAEAQLSFNKQRKLQNYFAANPHLLNRLCEVQKSAVDVKRQTKNSWKVIKDLPGWTPFFSYYFEKIAEICIDVIRKSDLSRNRKINKQLEVTRLFLNYQEDAEEGKNIPLEFYLDQLSSTLRLP